MLRPCASSPLRFFAPALLRPCASSPSPSLTQPYNITFHLLCFALLLILSANLPVLAQNYSQPVFSGGSSTRYDGISAPYIVLGSGVDYGTTRLYALSAFGGTINTQFTWNKGSNNTSPPPQVIVYQTSSASYSGAYRGITTGNCNNGFSDPVIKNQDGSYTCKGTHFSVLTPDTNGNITISCTPTATCGLNTYCSLDYHAGISSVTIGLTGLLTDSNGHQVLDNAGNPQIMVGQECTASIGGLTYLTGSTVNYVWSISGVTFQSLSPTFIGGPGTLTNSTAHWYWNDLRQTVETLICTATIIPPAGKGEPFTVTAKQLVDVVPRTNIASANPSNPTPIVLTTNTTLPIPLSGTLTGPNNSVTTVTATLYDSAQLPVVTLPAQPVRLDANGNGAASFNWDGKEADGTVAPPGVYLFQLNATISLLDSTNIWPSTVDTDKSPYLSVSTPSPDAQLVSDDRTTAQFTISYILSSTDTPARSASAGEIDVYDPNQAKVITQVLGTGDLTPGTHTVIVTMPSPKIEGDYVFLTSAQDNDADNDFAHRKRWALQHNQRWTKVKLPPIVYIKSDIWHVAWCRGGEPVGLSTNEIAQTARQPHFITRNFQQGATLPNTVTAASNGSLYSQRSAELPPIGGIGTGTVGHWDHTYNYAGRQLFSFGMTEQGGGFGSAPMKIVYLIKDRQRIKQYTVATSIQQSYPYGFGAVGLLINNGVPVSYSDFGGQWDTKQLSPTALEPRTALGWTKTGDFFIVTCNGINNIPAGFSGKTWDDVKNFFVTGLPQIIQQKYHQTVSISGAVMLDGGGSTMFAYRNVNQSGGNIQTDQGAPTGYDPQIITDYVLAVGDTSK